MKVAIKVQNNEEITFMAQIMKISHPLPRQTICPILFGVCCQSALAQSTMVFIQSHHSAHGALLAAAVGNAPSHLHSLTKQ